MNTKLRTVREESGKTQVQIAKESEISETQYQNIEYGTSNPTARTALRIADVLGIKSYKVFKEIFGD